MDARRNVLFVKALPMRLKNSSLNKGEFFPKELQAVVDDIARKGSTPLVVAENNTTLGVIELKDIVKGGIKERFTQLRQMGIKTVMITGDNPITAAPLAAAAGVGSLCARAQ